MTVTAIYDGNCVICNTTRVIINGLDWFNRVEFLDLHNRAEVETRYPSLDHERAMGEIHVFDADGTLHAGFAGTRRLLRAVPLGVPLWALTAFAPIRRWLGPKMYSFIAKNRYTINRVFGVDPDKETQNAACEEDGVCKIPEKL